MTTASWGPEKGRTASEKTDGLCEREMNRGRCADMWVSPHTIGGTIVTVEFKRIGRKCALWHHAGIS